MDNNVEKHPLELELLKEQIETEKAVRRLKTADAEVRESYLRTTLRQEKDTLANMDNNRTFHFFAPVNGSNVADTIETLSHWGRRDPGEPITIVFNSPGGSVFDGFALYDFIMDLRGRGHKLITKSLGMAASMGGILLQAGSERIMSPHGFMLIHEISAGAFGKASEIEDRLKMIEQLQKKALGILAERSTLSEKQIARRWKKNDWWLPAEEALELGFIDRIEA